MVDLLGQNYLGLWLIETECNQINEIISFVPQRLTELGESDCIANVHLDMDGFFRSRLYAACGQYHQEVSILFK